MHHRDRLAFFEHACMCYLALHLFQCSARLKWALTCVSSLQHCGWPREVLISSVAATFPFPLWPPPHASPSTIEISRSHYQPEGYRSIPFFSPLCPFPLMDPFPGVTAACHLNSHQFTHGEEVVFIGNPSSSSPSHTSPPRTHFWVPLTDCSLMPESTHTKNGTWLKTC